MNQSVKLEINKEAFEFIDFVSATFSQSIEHWLMTVIGEAFHAEADALDTEEAERPEIPPVLVQIV